MSGNRIMHPDPPVSTVYFFAEHSILIKKRKERAMKNQPEILVPGRMGDGNTPEIDLPKSDNATNIIPDEVPRRDGPGGEPGTKRV